MKKFEVYYKLPTESNELTRRQREVAMLAARGWTRKQIARQLAISWRTVQTHLQVIYRKQGVDSQTAAQAHMYENAPFCVPAGLTPREAEVMNLLAAGKQNKEIARALCVAYATAHTHLSNIYAKLGVASRAEAVARCMGG